MPDQNANVNVVPLKRPETPDDLIVKDKLRMTDQWWDKQKREVLEKYGELLSEEHRLPRILVTQEIYSYDYLERAQKCCIEIAENDALPAQDRIDACGMIGDLAEIGSKKAKMLIDVAEKANTKTSDVKKRNLPPNATLVQVNVGGEKPKPIVQARTEPKHVTMGQG